MAMAFEFSLRSLSGSCKLVQTTPDTSIKELRTSIEKDILDIPEFHTVKLFVGDNELREGTVAAAGLSQGSEVQLGIARETPEKAIEALSHMIDPLEQVRNEPEERQMVFREAMKKMEPVLNFLGEQDSLEPDQCKLMMEQVVRWACQVQSCHLDDSVAIFAKEMGKTVGLGCADGTAIARLLVRYLDWTEDNRHGIVLDRIVSYALVEMSFKKADAMYESILLHCSNLRLVITTLTSDLIDDLQDERASQLPLQLQKVCRFIEIFGASCSLNVDWTRYHNSKIKSTTLLAILNDAVEAAKQQGWYPVGFQDILFHFDLQDAAAAAAHAPADNGVEEDLTDCSLEKVLHESEIEALQIEQAQLQKALVQSKADIPGVDVVILEYSQSGRWFRDALLKNTELQEERAVLENAALSPQLHSGAKIFVAPEVYLTVLQHLEEQGWELESSYVVVARDLEAKIRSVVEAARASATKRERGGSCHVKARYELNASAMATGSAEDSSPGSSASPDSPASPDNMPFYLVKNTFVHVPIPTSMRTDSSFHAASAMW